MGKHRRQIKKGRQLTNGTVIPTKDMDAKTVTALRFGIDQILDKAEGCIDRFDYSMAQTFCQRALEIDADNVRALEVCASLLIEVGEQEKAIQCLGRVIALKPDEGHQKYLSLAQLQDGINAVACYNKGIEILTKQLEKSSAGEFAGGGSSDKDSDICTIKKDISAAHCAIGELYMTDLCFEENAEQQCLENLEKAIAVDETNPEGYQAMASFLLVKDDREAAKSNIQKSLSLWLPAFQAARDGKGDNPNLDPVEVCPLNFPTRIATSKILIELEEWDDAVDILDGLVEEDDSVVDVWYLLGWLNFLRGEDYKGNARYYLNKAVKVNKISESEDKSLIKHTLELLEELGPGDGMDSEEEKENEGEGIGDEDIDSTDDEEEKEEKMEV